MLDGSHHLVGLDGTIQEGIAVIGIPTEGNLVGNLTVAQGQFSSCWAADALSQ